MKFIKNVRIVRENGLYFGHLSIDKDGNIEDVFYTESAPEFFSEDDTYDGKGHILMPGIIDTHVHFRDPGMTHKGDLESESIAAARGGVTTVFDMPNTNPPTTDRESLLNKISSASAKSCIRCGFYIGATAGNIREGAYPEACGIKLFMGSSTGNMAVNDDNAIENIFRQREHIVVVHCEDDGIISANLKKAEEEYGDDIPFRMHPQIRDRKACVSSTKKALALAVKYGTRLHIAHVSTADEIKLIAAAKKHNPDITAETSVNYLWFDDSSNDFGFNIYDTKAALVKCNPAIKGEKDRKALIKAVIDGTIDTIATDHAPHLLTEKVRKYNSAPSGMPSIQHSLQMMLTLGDLYPELTVPRIAQLMSSRPAEIFRLKDRGKIEKGMKADFALVDPDSYQRVVSEIPDTKECDLTYSKIAYKCGWSPIEGEIVKGRVISTFVGGKPLFE